MGRVKKPKSIQSFIMPHLRRASRYWPPKSEARKRALRKIEIGKFKNGRPKFEDRYECAACKNLFPRELTQMDHIIEVASLTGFDSWDATIGRMFPDADGYQCLCNECHSKKSQGNQKIRRESKKTAPSWEKSLKKAKKMLTK